MIMKFLAGGPLRTHAFLSYLYVLIVCMRFFVLCFFVETHFFVGWHYVFFCFSLRRQLRPPIGSEVPKIFVHLIALQYVTSIVFDVALRLRGELLYEMNRVSCVYVCCFFCFFRINDNIITSLFLSASTQRCEQASICLKCWLV